MIIKFIFTINLFYFNELNRKNASAKRDFPASSTLFS